MSSWFCSRPGSTDLGIVARPQAEHDRLAQRKGNVFDPIVHNIVLRTFVYYVVLVLLAAWLDRSRYRCATSGGARQVGATKRQRFRSDRPQHRPEDVCLLCRPGSARGLARPISVSLRDLRRSTTGWRNEKATFSIRSSTTSS